MCAAWLMRWHFETQCGACRQHARSRGRSGAGGGAGGESDSRGGRLAGCVLRTCVHLLWGMRCVVAPVWCVPAALSGWVSRATTRNRSVCAAETDITETGVAALAASVHSNYVLRVCYVSEGDGDLSRTGRALWRELACHYRVPHVRLVVRIRVMCQAGRCRAAGARRGEIIAWLCERAPLWVVTHVCSLLRCPAIATAAPLEFA